MFHLIGNLRRFFNLSTNSPATNRAIFSALIKQIPLMYAIVVINMFSLAYTHFNVAPKPLTLIVPMLLAVVAIARSINLWRAQPTKVSDDYILAKLKWVVRLATIVGVLFAGWALSLFQYGNVLMQVHVAFFVCITVIGCVFCLMHLRPAAVALSIAVIVPSVIVFGLASHGIFLAIVINILLVGGSMLFVLSRHSREFVQLVENQETLTRQGKRLVTLNSENRRLANLDSLTELPNRRNFFGGLAEMIEQSRINGERLCVGLLDLDGFKPINDIFGHPAGDRLLIETSQRLRHILDEDITLARLGGDEFGIVIRNPEDNESIISIGEKICAALQVPFDIREGLARISGSLGFAIYPEAGNTATLLFERADYALCYAKQHNKGSTVLFSQEHETIIREVSNIEHRLREADLEEELLVVFQPIVDTQNNHTVGMEALARWKSPVLGNVPPDAFIRSAERSGTIGELTIILFKKALKTASQWPSDIYLSFNLSALDLSSPDSILRLMKLVQDSEISAKRIVFEITESAVMQDFDRANESLQLIKLTGATIALDDFGTGFSSLSYVQRMPIDRIKVDRSFVMDIDRNKATRDIVRSVIDLCRNLDLLCVVEGVETQAQLDALHDIGCRMVQGYYFSKPLEAADALAFLDPEMADARAQTNLSQLAHIVI